MTAEPVSSSVEQSGEDNLAVPAGTQADKIMLTRQLHVRAQCAAAALLRNSCVAEVLNKAAAGYGWKGGVIRPRLQQG